MEGKGPLESEGLLGFDCLIEMKKFRRQAGLAESKDG
jgi:hypothetical protein